MTTQDIEQAQDAMRRMMEALTDLRRLDADRQLTGNPLALHEVTQRWTDRDLGALSHWVLMCQVTRTKFGSPPRWYGMPAVS
jgi:hypothetical protein